MAFAAVSLLHPFRVGLCPFPKTEFVAGGAISIGKRFVRVMQGGSCLLL